MIQTPFKPAAEPGSLAVAIRNGNFAWQKGGDSLLRDINLQVPAGQLIIVIGEVKRSSPLQIRVLRHLKQFGAVRRVVQSRALHPPTIISA